MGDSIVNCLAHFGLGCKDIKKERAYYICTTNIGPFKIYKTIDIPAGINLQHDIKEHLAANGFKQTDRFRLTNSGHPYIILGRETYVATLYLSGRELNWENSQDVLLGIETVARFHTAARSVVSKSEILKAPSLMEVYSHNGKYLSNILKQARRRTKLSDFDLLMIKNAPDFLNQIKEAIEILEKTDYAGLRDLALADGHICHNGLKEENLPIADGVCYITRFSEANIDLQLTDVASFIRRYAFRSRNQDLEIGRMLEVYDKILPLPLAAPSILYAQLLFPAAVMKIVSLYYSKKRPFTPGGITNRMAEILAEKGQYEKYIQQLL